MYVLLSVCLVLHPQRIDESLQAVLREKPHAERIVRMQKGELQVAETKLIMQTAVTLIFH